MGVNVAARYGEDRFAWANLDTPTPLQVYLQESYYKKTLVLVAFS